MHGTSFDDLLDQPDQSLLSRQKRQRRLLMGVGLAVLAVGVFLQLLRAGSLNVVPQFDSAGWIILLAFLALWGGMITALAFDKTFSRVTSILASSAVGLALCFFFEPLLGAAAGAAGGVWTAAFGVQGLRMMLAVVTYCSAVTLAGFAARFALIMLDAWAWAGATTVLLSLVFLAWWLCLRIGKDKSGKKMSTLEKMVMGAIFSLSGLILVGFGWLVEPFAIAELNPRTWYYGSQGFTAPGYGLAFSNITTKPNSKIWQRHIASQKHVAQLDLDLEGVNNLEGLRNLREIDWLSLKSAQDGQLAELSNHLTKVRWLSLDNCGEKVMDEIALVPGVVRFLFNKSRVTPSAWKSITASSASKLTFWDCSFSSTRIPLQLKRRLRAFAITGEASDDHSAMLAQLPDFENLVELECAFPLTAQELMFAALCPKLKSLATRVKKADQEILAAITTLRANGVMVGLQCECKATCNCAAQFAAAVPNPVPSKFKLPTESGSSSSGESSTHNFDQSPKSQDK